MKDIFLGVNIDHIATLRNARGENDPSLIEMVHEVIEGGADSLTMHLREDRRHIQDADIFEIKKHSKVPINFEMAVTNEMIDIALELKPASVCLVPEKREEQTTEGGLDISVHFESLQTVVSQLQKEEIEVYLFVEPNQADIEKSAKLHVKGVELHTGKFARSFINRYQRQQQLDAIKQAAKSCQEFSLECHAGHGLNYHNISSLLFLKNLTEVNIGHAIIARSLKVGLRMAVEEMKFLLQR